MGIVWETYHKGVPLLGVPGITLDLWNGVSLGVTRGEINALQKIGDILESLGVGGEIKSKFV